MATEDTEATPNPETAAVAPSGSPKSGSLLKAVGLTFGLLLLLLVTQLAAPILGCKLLNSMTPNCPPPPVVVAGEDKPVKNPKGPPVYLPMDPPLVVSLEDQGAIRFLQVTVEVMARDEKLLEDVKTHMPVIRNNLLMLFGGQTIANLTSREDKERLRAEALAEVQKILKANPRQDKGKVQGTVEELYFTSFVVQ